MAELLKQKLIKQIKMTTLLIQTAILLISIFFSAFLYVVGNYFKAILFAIVAGGMLFVVALELLRGCGV